MDSTTTGSSSPAVPPNGVQRQENGADAQVQVRFRTRQKHLAVTDTAILVPARLKRYGLSEIINHLLESDKPIPFNFLVDGRFLQTSLSSYLDSSSLSTENIVELEYVEATLPPTESATYEHDEWISSVRAHARAPIVLTGSYDSLARIWDRSGNCKAVLKGHAGPVKTVAWIPETGTAARAHRFLTGGQDYKLFGWEYKLDVTTGQASTRIEFECVGHTGSVDAVAVHAAGSHIASASSDGSVLMWSADPTDVEESEKPEPRKRRKTDKGDVAGLVGIPLKRAIKRLAGHVGAVSAVSYDQTTDAHAPLYTGGWDHSVRVWDVENGSTTSTMNCEKVVLDMDHSAVSGLLVTGHSDNAVRLWDPRATDNLVTKLSLTSHTSWVSSVRWSPTSAYAFASGSYDSSVKVWDIRSTAPLYTLSGGDVKKEEKVFGVDWCGDLIFSGGEDAKLRTFECRV
ncbi:WD repeat-containing protein 12 [Thoreauomyces humboldtii]|nr:WD repeat-containing protein 12 [Thoreauomyces humboldtii]